MGNCLRERLLGFDSLPFHLMEAFQDIVIVKLQWFENMCVFYIYFVLGFWVVMGLSVVVVVVQSAIKGVVG